MSGYARTAVVTVLGAVAGATAAFLLFTDQGRRLQRQLEAALGNAAEELSGFRGALRNAAVVASEGWNLLHETLGKESQESRRETRSRRTAPF